jgi:hypothetical protein
VRDAVQFVVHERRQAFERRLVAGAPGQQQLGEIPAILCDALILRRFRPMSICAVPFRLPLREAADGHQTNVGGGPGRGGPRDSGGGGGQ